MWIYTLQSLFVFVAQFFDSMANNKLNSRDSAFSRNSRSLSSVLNPSAYKIAVGQFETGRFGDQAERVMQGIVIADSSEESNSIAHHFLPRYPKPICAKADASFISPQIVMSSTNFWNWLAKVPNSLKCDDATLLAYDVVKCPIHEHSSLVFSLPQNYILMACVNDVTGIVLPSTWKIRRDTSTDYKDALLSSLRYDADKELRINRRFEGRHVQHAERKPVCTLARLTYNGQPIGEQEDVACWCKGDLCSYVLFDHVGFNPGPFVHLEEPFALPLDNQVAVDEPWYTSVRFWLIVLVPTLCFILFLVAVIPACKCGGDADEEEQTKPAEPSRSSRRRRQTKPKVLEAIEVSDTVQSGASVTVTAGASVSVRSPAARVNNSPLTEVEAAMALAEEMSALAGNSTSYSRKVPIASNMATAANRGGRGNIRSCCIGVGTGNEETNSNRSQMQQHSSK